MDDNKGLLSELKQQRHDDEQSQRKRPSMVWILVVVTLVTMALVTRRTFGGDGGSAAGEAPFVASATPFDRHFATKTVYWDQRKAGADSHHKGRRSLRLWPNAPFVEASREATESRVDHGMRLIQTQFVTRHGIRYPTLTPIKDVESLLRKLAPFESHLPAWLRGYALQYNQSVEGELSETGAQEMEQYAQRLLTTQGHKATREVYSSERFQLSHTHVKRTKDSALAFVRRYFTNPQDVEYIERPKHNDTLLRFFDICERYQKQVKHNASAIHEMRAFAQSRAIHTSIKQLEHGLGVDDQATITLTVKDLTAAFSACAFDVALFHIHDQWCSLFTPRMVETLDYYDDLKAFYQLAGGHAINYEMASVLLRDIVELMDQRIRGVSSLDGVFRFAHAETTLPLMTLLGMGDKTPLKATASAAEIQTRGFRTSALASFAANIAFRLYEKETPGQIPEYFVQVLVNERDDVVLPGCDNVVCSLETLKTHVWKRFLYEYDFDEQCRV